MRIILVFAIAALLGCSEETSQEPVPVAPTSQPAIETPVAPPPSVSRLPDTNWALHGNDTGEQRYSDLDQITRDNVDELGLAWSFDLYTRRGVEATPLVIDGVIYVTGSWSMVYALDARTGELKCLFDPLVDRAFLA